MKHGPSHDVAMPSLTPSGAITPPKVAAQAYYDGKEWRVSIIGFEGNYIISPEEAKNMGKACKFVNERRVDYG
jgi:hypothetical protein